MSLRRVSEAGLGEPPDKTTLAAFGTRKLRTECVLLRRQFIGSEGHVKELMRVNDEIGRREENMKKDKAKKLYGELEALKAKLIETETSIQQLISEKGELGKSLNLEGRVNALEGGIKDMKMSHPGPRRVDSFGGVFSVKVDILSSCE
ncbi:hypothetical protein B9Z19DRAFT_1134099 [Tuber borchii]|uniref:Uncharacterized protein n=1 Tax=Tuber borchii TaxID=42251 RepID=A0A2T6ZEM9_TUBBO|nr:hypothetical protein B9Z19DRAFT_1134099 [Tuber borchii]